MAVKFKGGCIHKRTVSQHILSCFMSESKEDAHLVSGPSPCSPVCSGGVLEGAMGDLWHEDEQQWWSFDKVKVRHPCLGFKSIQQFKLMLAFPCIPPRVAPMERVQMQLQPILLIALIIQLIIQGDFSCLNESKHLNERIAVQFNNSN